MATTTYGDISQRTAAYAAVEMLSHAEPILVLSKFGQSKPLPKNKADNVKFRRPIPFAVADSLWAPLLHNTKLPAAFRNTASPCSGNTTCLFARFRIW